MMERALPPSIKMCFADRADRSSGYLASANTQVLDVHGTIVSSGFIDCHAHFDAPSFWDQGCDPRPSAG